ncbi:hypothetical protein [Microbispora sp. NPDC049125]|uniref:hypothetical protein n=1 Tax=Microbispora sp. NPDC049125 TaxID=3154929 RepID=UPI00346651DA
MPIRAESSTPGGQETSTPSRQVSSTPSRQVSSTPSGWESSAPRPRETSTPHPRAQRKATALDDDPDGNHVRDGRITFDRSPRTDRGYQHSSINTVAGGTTVQNGLCRRSRVCKIVQKITVVTPERTVTATPRPTSTSQASPKARPSQRGGLVRLDAELGVGPGLLGLLSLGL